MPLPAASEQAAEQVRRIGRSIDTQVADHIVTGKPLPSVDQFTRSIRPRVTVMVRAAMEDIDPDEIRAAPLEPARVKWFDKGKGFGFANVFGLDGDVFIHIEVLRKSGLADLQPGEAVGLRAIDGRRGRMAVEVTAWDAALRTR